ncbi:MAG: hypothetical protein NTX97_01485 [Bacteroidetes bacterium]|nr:hypothetical protein [Bacteroidota bacterium]
MKKITFKLILVMALISLSGLLHSQPMGPPPPPPKEKGDRQRDKKENIESMKIAFITNKLDLTPEEAQKFWPVYNQFNDKLQEMRKKRREEDREAKKNFDDMTDKETDQLIENNFAFQQKELDLQKEYNVKFKAVLPIKKVAKLYATEEQFKRVLIDKLKDKDRPPVGN